MSPRGKRGSGGMPPGRGCPCAPEGGIDYQEDVAVFPGERAAVGQEKRKAKVSSSMQKAKVQVCLYLTK